MCTAEFAQSLCSPPFKETPRVESEEQGKKNQEPVFSFFHRVLWRYTEEVVRHGNGSDAPLGGS